jgi:hypothetical protein
MPRKKVPEALSPDLLCRKVRIWLQKRGEGRFVEGEVERQGKEWCVFPDPKQGHWYFNKTRWVDLWSEGCWVPLFTPKAVKKNPGSYGRANGNARITPENVMEIRKLMKEGVLARVVGEKFKINETTVRNIDQGKSWSWVKEEDFHVEEVVHELHGVVCVKG